MTRMRLLWIQLRSSLWFIPTLIVSGAILLAIVLVQLDTIVKDDLLARWPRLFGASAEGSRAMLSAIASSMITVAGVTFSITIAALAQTSTQYTPRILRTFMRNRPNQIVLGMFVGIFAYCVVVLRTIRSIEESRFVPSLAVLTGVALALVGVGVLIFFIHNIASSLQASSIVASVVAETRGAIEHLFPERLGEPGTTAPAVTEVVTTGWTPVPAPASGYVQSVDSGRLLRMARERGVIVRMERGVGEFVVEGMPLVSVDRATQSAESLAEEIAAAYGIGRHRTVEQDAGFGIRQIVDIALKALSPGVNETTTALMCVDYLSSLLCDLARRRMPEAHRFEGDQLRVIAVTPTFEQMLAESYDPIRRNAEGNVEVLVRILEALATIAECTTDADRRSAVLDQTRLVAEAAERGLTSPLDRTLVAERVQRIEDFVGSRIR